MSVAELGSIEIPNNYASPLYEKILGAAWNDLPAPIRDLHDNFGSKRVAGKAVVERGRNLIAVMIAKLLGVPEAGSDVPVTVQFDVRDGIEHWQRTFAGKRFVSTQRAGRGRSHGLVEERFGPLRFGLALVLDSGRLYLIVRRWSILGLPMPAFLEPTGTAYEHAENGRFNFHVEITHPLFGLIVRYRGWLIPSA